MGRSGMDYWTNVVELTAAWCCSVLKALCVGAKGVGIGRAALYSSVSTLVSPWSLSRC